MRQDDLRDETARIKRAKVLYHLQCSRMGRDNPSEALLPHSTIGRAPEARDSLRENRTPRCTLHPPT
jgi:hypothetical protein